MYDTDNIHITYTTALEDTIVTPRSHVPGASPRAQAHGLNSSAQLRSQNCEEPVDEDERANTEVAASLLQARLLTMSVLH